jgi:hypothetical protein
MNLINIEIYKKALSLTINEVNAMPTVAATNIANPMSAAFLWPSFCKRVPIIGEHIKAETSKALILIDKKLKFLT